MQKDALSEALGPCRRAFLWIGAIALCINLLTLAVPVYMMQVYDRVLTTQSIDTLLALTAITVFALLVLAGLDAIRGHVMLAVAGWLDGHLGRDVLRNSVRGALNAVPQASGGTAQGLRDLSTVRGFLTGPAIFPLFDAPWVPVFMAVVFLIHPLLGWTATGGALVLFVFALANELATRRALAAAGAESIRSLNEADRALRNADVIEAMGMMDSLSARWQKDNGRVIGHQGIASRRAIALTAVAKTARMGLQVAMLGIGAWLVTQHEITGGAMIAASIIMARAVAPVEQSIGGWRSVISARSSYRRLQSLFADNNAAPGAKGLPPPQGRLSVDNVTFALPGRREPVLQQISFSLLPGESLGLIGPTAAGKTTLVRLIVGSLQPTVGDVRLDGAAMASWDASERGRYVGYLPQDVELFDGTVADNIARMSDAPREDVIAAAQMAGVHDLILHLPDGYDTAIGPGGAVLSGGQRQRIGLARAVFGRPRLVVLDEPYSNLDRDGELALLETAARLRADGATVVMVAHRPNVLGHVDKVLVLQEGKVSMFGPRDEVFGKLNRPRPVPDALQTQA